MNMLYRNKETRELVRATIKTVKRDLKVYMHNIETGADIILEVDDFKDNYEKVMSPQELIPLELLLVKRYV